MNKKKGTVLIALGLLLLCAALLLTVYNMQTELHAGRSAARVTDALASLRNGKTGAADAAGSAGGTAAAGDGTGAAGAAADGGSDPSALHGEGADGTAGDAGAGGLQPAPQPEQLPDYLLYPDMEMPVAEVDGHFYIGAIFIHELGMELPVMTDWSYPQLKIAPCRYSGSAYKGDLVIVAHNYVTHFGKMRTLPAGSPITLIDVEGNVFEYAIAEIEILKPHQLEELLSTDYPLSLVTCTLGGEMRIVVRCVMMEDFIRQQGE
jgi:sortase A